VRHTAFPFTIHVARKAFALSGQPATMSALGQISFPVGRIDCLTVRPKTFVEYL
jgi:hypothetical protein